MSKRLSTLLRMIDNGQSLGFDEVCELVNLMRENNEHLRDELGNVAMLLRRTCRRLKGQRNRAQDDKFIAQAHRYLRNHALMPSPLRGGEKGGEG